MKLKMKLWMSAILFAISSLFLTNCAKENPITEEEKVTNPVLTTSAVTDVTQNSAKCGGVISVDYEAEVIGRGICWSKNPVPTIADNYTENGTGFGDFTSNLTELTANTTYYVRAYVISNKGADYGNEISFTTQNESTPITSTVTDIEGNTYKTIKLGTQTWMAENLKVTKFNNGSSIPNVTNQTEWYELTTPALCDYENTPSNSETYGKLYNWYAVGTGKLCPSGWHVPSTSEWADLTTYLSETGYSCGGAMYPDRIAKAMASSTGWQTSTFEGVIGNDDYPEKQNASGFNGLPGGMREYDMFANIGQRAYWWSSTDDFKVGAYERILSYSWKEMLYDGMQLYNGLSVRCIKD